MRIDAYRRRNGPIVPPGPLEKAATRREDEKSNEKLESDRQSSQVAGEGKGAEANGQERKAIKHQLGKAEASISSAELAAEEESARLNTQDSGEEGSKGSDMLVELLIARLLRVSYRDDLLRTLTRQFFGKLRQG